MNLFSFFSSKKPKETSTDDFKHLCNKELLLEIVNSNSNMMLIYSKQKGWIGANKEFYDILDYEDINDFKRQHDSVRDIFLSESEEIFTEDDASWLNYIQKRKNDGYHVRLYNAKSVILDIHLKVIHSTTSNDIYFLELKDMSEIYLSRVHVKEVEQLKSKFLSNIGHEFRTPMNGVIGFVDLLSQTQLTTTQEEYLNLISHSSRSLMSNIETLLDLSQLQGGRLTLDNANFEIVSHMEELIYNHVIVAKERGIKVFSFIDPKLPQEINSDIRKLKQIMNALTQNAIKFTPRGGRVIIEVKLLKRQVNGECSVGFSVKDNGKGISRKDIKYILEPFVSGTHADERLGVGLSLCKGLINLFGSELHIKSEELQGSNFNFVIDFSSSKGQTYKMMPKKKVKVLLLDQSKIDEANFIASYLRSFAIDVVKSNTLDENIYKDIDALYIVANQGDSSWMFQLGTYKKSIPVLILLDENEKLQTKLTHIVDEVVRAPLFPSQISKHLSIVHSIELKAKETQQVTIKEHVEALIVEDNLINQRLLQVMLKEYNIVSCIASNGNEAISMSAQKKYDIIFMDIDMPEKNGIVATQEIKQKRDFNTKTPIVAFTAMAMQGDREKLLKQGLDDYLEKPLNREDLEVILNKYLKVLLV